MALVSQEMQLRVQKVLVDEGLVDPEAMDQVATEAVATRKPMLALLNEKGLVSSSAIVHVSAAIMGVPYIELNNIRIDPSILNNIPQDVANRMMSVAVAEKDNQVVVAVTDAMNIQITDYLATVINKPILIVAASEEGISHILTQYKGDATSISRAAKETEEEGEKKEEEAQAKGEVKTITQDSEISRALNSILEYASKSKASDIHVEPLENALIVRCRIDGVLRKIWDLPKSMEPPLVSRIKILANLKIDEHRVPQDGQFTVRVGDKDVDLRIAISPVIWGEQVVIRLLDKTETTLEIESMGVTGRALKMILNGISKPNGMVLTSGPTGSGKTTTLYALVRKIKKEAINIVTLEDPVEYKMDGVNQIQVNTDAGLTFASGLRSILRQDPDVVMVGEIRDSETAGLAVQAALTGHLVFSTLHTNSAAGILPRLLDMGVEPFLLASTLNTVIGQRLVRRVAPKRETYQSSEMETKEITELVGDLLPKSKEEVAKVGADLGYDGLPVLGAQQAYTMVKGIDTRDTPGGYVGRCGIYETIDVDEDIQKLVVARATSADIMRVAKLKGTVTMRQDGILKALTGITTLDEVNRVASDIT